MNGRFADELLSAGECNAGRREVVSLIVGDGLGAVPLAPPHGDARVGCAQVDANYGSIAPGLGGSHLRNGWL